MIIDVSKEVIFQDDESKVDLYSPQGFKIISDLWLNIGWDQKYSYGFSWLGRPIIQIPEDLLLIQEVIFVNKPDTIIETGIAHGGSLIFYASILNAVNSGRVIGIDIEIRPHNRKAIEEHPLYPHIELIESNSIDPGTVEQIKSKLNSTEKVMVILDSLHDYEHVMAEIKLYSQLVSVGSYIVVTDGIRGHLGVTPKAKREHPNDVNTWSVNNPSTAAREFVENNPNFQIVEPEFIFNESCIDFRVTCWPSSFLMRIQ